MTLGYLRSENGYIVLYIFSQIYKIHEGKYVVHSVANEQLLENNWVVFFCETFLQYDYNISSWRVAFHVADFLEDVSV